MGAGVRRQCNARWQAGRVAQWRRMLVSALALSALLASAIGCTPTVNILGTYFPPSLVSAAIGLIASYLVVRLLARRSPLRQLAQSSLFFGSLTVIVGFLAWWSLFREF